MPVFKRICVVGGTDENKEFRAAAHELGRALAARKIALVYGGGIQGLQGCVAAAAQRKGSEVLSVLLDDGSAPKITYGGEAKSPTKVLRLGTMFVNADAFIVLPGGLETLEQIIALMFWADRSIPRKTIGLLNVNGFYDGLLTFLDQAVEQKFVTQEARRVLISGATADELFELWQYPPIKPTEASSQKIQSRFSGDPDTTLRL